MQRFNFHRITTILYIEFSRFLASRGRTNNVEFRRVDFSLRRTEARKQELHESKYASRKDRGYSRILEFDGGPKYSCNTRPNFVLRRVITKRVNVHSSASETNVICSASTSTSIDVSKTISCTRESENVVYTE